MRLWKRRTKVVSDAEYARILILGTYNAERHRGVEHSDEWKAYMAQEQAWFDEREGCRA